VDNSGVDNNKEEEESRSKAVQKRLRQKGVADQVMIKAV
jgi:hypothetical protein